MKFEAVMATTVGEVLRETEGNQSRAAKIIGVTRSTLAKYIDDPDKVMLVQIDGKLKPFVSDRRNGHYKKAS